MTSFTDRTLSTYNLMDSLTWEVPVALFIRFLHTEFHFLNLFCWSFTTAQSMSYLDLPKLPSSKGLQWTHPCPKIPTKNLKQTRSFLISETTMSGRLSSSWHWHSNAISTSNNNSQKFFVFHLWNFLSHKFISISINSIERKYCGACVDHMWIYWHFLITKS